MSDQQKETLKQKVAEFVRVQPGYDDLKHEKLDAFCENKDTWAVVYGDDIHSGIAGFGETVDEAYKDFVLSWEHFKGFKWLENEKKRLFHWKDLR